MSRVIAITGASGYLAQHLIPYIAKNLANCDLLVGFDIKKNYNIEGIPFKYNNMNILDLSPEILQEYGVTDIIHMAWTVTPTHNIRKAFNVDILGTEHVLTQARDAGIEYFLHTSSTLAYGAHADNPNPLEENHLLRGNTKFHYSYHKMLAEQKIEEFKTSVDYKMKIGLIRPSPILSADLKNFVKTILDGGWRTFFLMPHPDPKTPIQFLHVTDAVQAFYLMVEKRLEGAYNATPDESVRVGEIPSILNGRGVNLPLNVLKALTWIQWNLRLSEVPPSYLDFVAFPYVGSNKKLKAEGFNPSYSTEQTLKTLQK